MRKYFSDPNVLDQIGQIIGVNKDVFSKYARSGSVVEYEPGEIICREGNVPSSLVVLLSGKLRVERTSSEGRELVLETISGGQSCSVSCSSLLTFKPYIADILASTTCVVWHLPAQHFRNAMDELSPFRGYIYRCVESGIINLSSRLEEVAFVPMETRTARFLLENADGDDAISLTHHQLALNLNSAREVISRILKCLVDRGLITTRRGLIRIVDRARLELISNSSHV